MQSVVDLQQTLHSNNVLQRRDLIKDTQQQVPDTLTTHTHSFEHLRNRPRTRWPLDDLGFLHAMAACWPRQCARDAELELTIHSVRVCPQPDVLTDGLCCLQAMESSTKNSSEMLEKLTLTFNRTRQAKITTELNEIISGALSLEDAEKS